MLNLAVRIYVGNRRSCKCPHVVGLEKFDTFLYVSSCFANFGHVLSSAYFLTFSMVGCTSSVWNYFVVLLANYMEVVLVIFSLYVIFLFLTLEDLFAKLLLNWDLLWHLLSCLHCTFVLIYYLIAVREDFSMPSWVFLLITPTALQRWSLLQSYGIPMVGFSYFYHVSLLYIICLIFSTCY